LLIKKSKAEFGLPTAVITNGSLLYHRDVQEDLLAADIVIPTLDAANPDLFKKINRPHKAIDYFDMVDGLIDFRRQFQGQFWLEVMLMADVNDSDEQLKLISRVVQEMKPQKVFVMTPIRPPTEKWVKCPSQRRVKAAGRMLANVVVLDNRESGDFGIAEFADAAEATLNIAGRHPLRLEQARTIAEKFNEANVIEDLLQDGKIEVSRYSQIEYIRPCKNQLKNGTETK
jgi:wyosine [tRNA(Phe)-imidazoG37] synthetase (radical SAM superfamily)